MINPAFPTVVYWIPICCRLEAINKNMPQLTPPISKCFVFFLSVFSSGFIFLKSIIHGSNTKPPISVLTALNVYGPTYSIPTLCATNATPHIVAVSNNISDCLNVYLFITIPFF